MFRKIISKISESLNERVAASRKNYQVPVKVSFEPERHSGRLDSSAINLSISGETSDLSASGIAFIVASIRIKEKYLVGDGRTLNVELDLPNGKVQMQVVGQRYEQVGQHISTARFLVGAKIVNISRENREVYEEFLRLGNKIKKASLTLGVDQG